MYWVEVQCEFQCRACGRLSPINYLDLDGSVRCLYCGLDQAFARASWTRALDHAHALGDLGAAHAESREPHAWLSIARENPMKGKTSAEDVQSGMVSERGMQFPTSLRIDARLREPQCQACSVPLVVQRQGPGQVHTTCPCCGSRDQFAMPIEAPGLCAGLRAVIASEHSTEFKPTRVQCDAAHPEAVTLECPGCGAAIGMNPGTRLAVCQYCRTTSRIPEKAFARAGADAKQEPFWLAFDGPSLLRKQLLREPGVLSPTTPLLEAKLAEPPVRKRPTAVELGLMVALPLVLLALYAFVDLVLLADYVSELPF